MCAHGDCYKCGVGAAPLISEQHVLCQRGSESNIGAVAHVTPSTVKVAAPADRAHVVMTRHSDRAQIHGHDKAQTTRLRHTVMTRRTTRDMVMLSASRHDTCV